MSGNGSEVREVRGLRPTSAAAIAAYAERGWRAEPAGALPLWSSPSGPLARARFYALFAVDAAVELHEPLARASGLPPPVALFLLLLVAVAASTAALLGCAVWLGPTRRRPVAVPQPQPQPAAGAAGAPPRPHAD